MMDILTKISMLDKRTHTRADYLYHEKWHHTYSFVQAPNLALFLGFPPQPQLEMLCQSLSSLMPEYLEHFTLFLLCQCPFVQVTDILYLNSWNNSCSPECCLNSFFLSLLSPFLPIPLILSLFLLLLFSPSSLPPSNTLSFWSYNVLRTLYIVCKFSTTKLQPSPCLLKFWEMILLSCSCYGWHSAAQAGLEFMSLCPQPPE